MLPEMFGLASSWTIERQVEPGQIAGELAAPVFALRSKVVGLQPRLLPVGIIGELELQLRKRRWFTAEKRSVERAKIPGDDSVTPAVGNNVMDGEREQMLPWPEVHKPPTHERTCPEIKRTACFLVNEVGFKISGTGSAKITRVESGQVERQSRSDELSELAPFALKGRAKRLVPGHDFVQRPAEHCLVERTMPAQSDAHVQRWVAARL